MKKLLLTILPLISVMYADRYSRFIDEEGLFSWMPNFTLYYIFIFIALYVIIAIISHFWYRYRDIPNPSSMSVTNVGLLFWGGVVITYFIALFTDFLE